MRATERRCSRAKPTRANHPRRPVYIDFVAPLRLVAILSFLVSIAVCDIAAIVWVGGDSSAGALGLMAAVGCGIFGSFAWEEASKANQKSGGEKSR